MSNISDWPERSRRFVFFQAPEVTCVGLVVPPSFSCHAAAVASYLRGSECRVFFDPVEIDCTTEQRAINSRCNSQCVIKIKEYGMPLL